MTYKRREKRKKWDERSANADDFGVGEQREGHKNVLWKAHSSLFYVLSQIFGNFKWIFATNEQILLQRQQKGRKMSSDAGSDSIPTIIGKFQQIFATNGPNPWSRGSEKDEKCLQTLL